MSKKLWILWQSLRVTPAILLATLLVSANAVRAAEKEGQLAAEPQAAALTTQPQIDVESSPAESLQKSAAKPVALSLAPSQLRTQVAVTSTPQPSVAPEVASSVEMSKSVSLLSTPPADSTVTKQATSLINSPAKATSQTPVALPATPSATAKIAQSAPASSQDGTTLQQINRYSNEGRSSGESLDQVTNVSQFSDVRPGDWAYEALRELVERYGCIAGYPDSTYRGNRALTRYEFAAGLRACLNQIEKLIAASTSEFASKDDLEKLRRLVQEFQAELATLGTRVDKLEGRVGFLENHQFSTTTKLVGEAIFAASAPLQNRGSRTNDKNAVLGDRVRLELQTSFTGQDILHTRLAAGNLRPFNLGVASRSRTPTGNFNGTGINTFEGQQTFNYTGSSQFNNGVSLDWLAYEFPYKASKIYVAATGGVHSDYAPVLNPYFYDGDGGNGSLSTFAQESPIYRIGGGAGAGIRFGLGKIGVLGPTSLTFGYLAGDANNPGRSQGLTSGDYGALGQINVNLFDRLAVGVTYVNGYHTSGSGIYNVGILGQPLVGSSLANNPALASGLASTASSTALRAGRISTNSYGAEAAFRLSEHISLSGFGMRTNATVLDGGGASGNGQIWSYGGGVAFSDFGKKGSVLGLFAGLEPTLEGFRKAGGGTTPFSRNNSYHVEGFYKFQLTDNISVSPGVIWVSHPNQDNRDPGAIIGTLRTTFTF